jgi:DNA polymerase III epsilon subunit-like protein
MNEKFIVLDTETTNDIDCPLAYDIGFAVIDKQGKVYESFSFVVAEIFLDEELMSSAFFAEKIPMYWEQIVKGERKIKRLYNIRKTLAEVMQKYNTKIVIAHNARFDYISTATTQRYLTKSKYRYFFPYGTEIWDTLKMSREIFKDDENYCAFCTENEYVTKNNSVKLTAEILYRYLTNDISFIESHTGLEDVLIEKEIFVHCVQKNPEINGRLW